jgi:enoyl-CoA hydratase
VSAGNLATMTDSAPTVGDRAVPERRPVRVERAGALAILTLDSPPLNLFDSAMLDALDAELGALAAEPPRGLLIRAEGRVVSGGVDVDSLVSRLEPATAGPLFDQMLRIVRTVESLALPTVFAAHALTLTAAFELALACDLLLAAESARFGLVEAVVGLTPGMGGTQRLVERAGPARAREVVFTGELFAAATLERWNVVNRVLPDDGFDAAARAFAKRLAEGPTRAHVATKRIVRAVLDNGGVPAGDRAVPSAVRPLLTTEDYRRAVASFREHGPGHATYEGR